MNYAKQASRPSPAAMLGALGVPAAFGAVLIAGLAVTVVMTEPKPNPTGVIVTPKPIEPLPPPPKTDPKPNLSQSQNTSQVDNSSITAPLPLVDLGSSGPIAELPDFGADVIGPVDLGIDRPAPPPSPMFNPVKASPIGNPGNWVTDNDYRSSWVRRGYSGRASFTLEITATGKVSNCSITRSTGHNALDEATCKLLAERAEFNPAKDSSGNAVAGVYSNSINWNLPK